MRGGARTDDPFRGCAMVSNFVGGEASRVPAGRAELRVVTGAADGVAAEGAVADGEDAKPDGDAATQRVRGRSAERDDSTEGLLRRYRQRGSRVLRDRVVERHRSTVESMAHGLASRLPPSVDAQDLVHAGMWGLIQAIAAYEPDRCDQFSAFMRIRVRGAMLDELRHMDFLPRLLRRRLRERNETSARLRMELEREPTETELANALGISEAALLRRSQPALVRAARRPDDDGESDQVDLLPDDDIESPIEAINRQELLEQIRQTLDPVEWKVLQLHYFEGMTGKQVARRLRLSASRICQIHGRVLDRLKAQLVTVS